MSAGVLEWWSAAAQVLNRALVESSLVLSCAQLVLAVAVQWCAGALAQLPGLPVHWCAALYSLFTTATGVPIVAIPVPIPVPKLCRPNASQH